MSTRMPSAGSLTLMIGVIRLNFFTFVDRFAHSNTANCPDSFLVSGILTRRGWMPFDLTGRGRITSSFPPCPLFPGLLGICLYVGPWALLLSLFPLILLR